MKGVIVTSQISQITEENTVPELPSSYEADRIRFLYRHAPTGLAVNVSLATLMMWVLWNRIPLHLLLTWLAVLMVLTAIRTYRLIRYSKLQPGDEDMSRWRAEFLLGSTLSGMVWGATGIVFTSFATFETQVFLTFALGGLVGGAAVILGSVLRVYLPYLVMIMLPITLWFLSQGEEQGLVMGAMLIVFSVAMSITAIIYRRVLLRSLLVAAQNDALLDANRAAETANRELANEINRRQAVEHELREREESYRSLYDDNPSMFFTLDVDGVILSANRFGAEHLGYDITELIGKNVVAIQPSEHTPLTRSWLNKCLENPGMEQRWETRKIRRDGAVIWVRETGRVQIEKDGRRTILTVCEDISEARALSEQLEYQASHDPLTDLYNRRKFEQIFEHLLQISDDSNTQHILCYLDLDRFKIINDTCGHVAGDRLLQELGKLFWSKIHVGDCIARLGGDEFGLLLERRSLAEALEVIHDIRDAVKTFRFSWGDKTFRLGMSIGVVEITPGRYTFDTAVSAADKACYAAKEKGRNRVFVYQEGDHEVAKRHGEVQRVVWLQNALDQDRLCLMQQPIIHLHGETQEVQLLEILVRFVDDAGQLVLPGELLMTAEQYGLSSQIDQWVITAAIAWFSNHAERLAPLQHFSINLSGRSVGSIEFMKFVTGEIKASCIPPNKFCFEITETAAIANIDAAKRMINETRSLGCRFALDDFGSGVSSFGYLKKLPVDYVKIDGMFVRNICEDPADLAMVRSINELGHVMGKRTIAEFVESSTILDKLRTLGVDYAQGYAVGKPDVLMA